MFIELHIIQNFVPACLNRDDTNTPKDCDFGGYRRARISSQCLKRAIRTSEVFRDTAGQIGYRTKYLGRLLKDRLQGAGRTEDDINQVIDAFALQYAGGFDKGDERTKVLLYIGEDEVNDMAQTLSAKWDVLLKEAREAAEAQQAKKGDKKKATPQMASIVKSLVEQHRNRVRSADIALFGRMLADSPEFNIDAACQVAHAISTHRVSMEMDFYTAVDDLQSQEETGAGMMGFISYDSACFYRYARLDWEQLATNLGGDVTLAAQAARAFLKAAVTAVPSARQNSFAAHNPPSFVLGVVRTNGMGWNLANAFETPVRPGRDEGLVDVSVRNLAKYFGRLRDTFGNRDIVATPMLALEDDLPIADIGEQHRVNNLKEFIETVMDAVTQRG